MTISEKAKQLDALSEALGLTDGQTAADAIAQLKQTATDAQAQVADLTAKLEAETAATADAKGAQATAEAAKASAEASLSANIAAIAAAGVEIEGEATADTIKAGVAKLASEQASTKAAELLAAQGHDGGLAQGGNDGAVGGEQKQELTGLARVQAAFAKARK